MHATMGGALSTVPRLSQVPAVSGEADVRRRAGGVAVANWSRDLAVHSRKDQIMLRKW